MIETKLPPMVDQAVAEFQQWWVDLREHMVTAPSEDLPLYHYTNASGLTGILSCGDIWLTNILHLNDPSEFAYGMGLAKDLMRERLEKEQPIAQGLLALMAAALGEAKTFTSVMGFFVASFSSNGDELEQWRAYGDDGRGFSIGVAPKVFQMSSLIERPKRPPNEAIILSRVIYDEQTAVQRQRTVIDKIVQIASRFASSDYLQDSTALKQFYIKMLSGFLTAIVWNSITTKHPAYRAEQETRVILLNESVALAPYVKTRVRGSEIVPYIPFQMDLRAPGAIAGVVVGPAAALQAEHGVKCLLQSQEIDRNDVISGSKIPYRC